MGIEYNTVRFLLQARVQGHTFGRVLTIGRQNVLLIPRNLDRLAREFNFSPSDLTKTQPHSALNYVEPVLTAVLKAETVESIDFSDYEGATHRHDMNLPIPEVFRGQFDTVIEAGTLEHVFNLPIALKNLMQAVKIGGSVFIQTPANNYFGHGFYQFSPELFYRVFSLENGFEILRMHLIEHFFPCYFFATKPYEVTDPVIARKRVQLVNNRPTFLLIEARKVAEKPIFANSPQQSDYLPRWKSSQSAMPTEAEKPVMLARKWLHNLYALPLKLVGFLPFQYLVSGSNKPSLSNRDFFKPTP